MVLAVHGLFRVTGGTVRDGHIFYRSVIARAGAAPVSYTIVTRDVGGVQRDGKSMLLSGVVRLHPKKALIVIDAHEATFLDVSFLQPFATFVITGTVAGPVDVVSHDFTFALEIYTFEPAETSETVLRCRARCCCVEEPKPGKYVQVLATAERMDGKAISFHVKDVELI